MTIQTKAIRPTCTKTPATRAYSNPTGRKTTADCNRDKAYDDTYGGGNGHLESVYSPMSCIALIRSEGHCLSCARLKPLINDYCTDCIALGANEKQVMAPREIQARSDRARANSQTYRWRKQ